jgi:hypothetical protein
MTQLSIGVMMLQSRSRFASAYSAGVPRDRHWEYVLEDIQDIMLFFQILQV